MKHRGMGLIVYGDEGIGKTGFALQFPKPLRCISVNETGYEDLDDIDEVPNGCENEYVDTHANLLQELRQSTDVRTVVVDSLSGYSQLMQEDIINTVYKREDNPLQAYGSFSEGPRIHGPIWAEQLEVVCNVLRAKGVNVILLGHTTIEKTKNIISTDYQSAMLNMEKWPRSVITKWAQAVLYLTMDFQIRNTKKWKGTATEAKVDASLEDEVDRIMYTTKHPSHSAKNRLTLPTYIPLGDSAAEAYENFIKHLPPKIKEGLLA